MIGIQGMWGIGDNIHQRAVIRALGPSNVVLETYYAAMYHDLLKEGLRCTYRHHPAPRIYDHFNRVDYPSINPHRHPRDIKWVKLTYNAPTIKANGSILGAQFASVGLKMPDKPDFSLPVPDVWRKLGFEKRKHIACGGRPVMIYRPLVLNEMWRCENRLPDPVAYTALFKSIRDRFFVISVADLQQKEWIVGDEQDADLKFHHGELKFEQLAGMVADAAMMFSSPGFGPVLAQAVRTPSITVYGGNETPDTTNVVGMHLAPSLFITPDHPCGCHSGRTPHNCDKYITMAPALEKLKSFVNLWLEVAA